MRLIAAIAILVFVLANAPRPSEQAAGLDLVESYFRGVEAGIRSDSQPRDTKAVVAARRALRGAGIQSAPKKRLEPIPELDLAAYRGLASWVDIFDRGPWERPIHAVKRMKRRGVSTLFLQTSTYGIFHPVFKRDKVARFLHAAHRRDMKVVAWYVPSFARMKVDLRRVRHALRFKTDRGHRFDSFALDIEAAVVDDISTRNKRLLSLSRRIRKDVGRAYPLGAITPDPCCSLYWPRFPYKEVSKHYDVFVPMGYWTFRASGYEGTRRYTSRNIAIIRRETGDPRVPIHMIGGIADSAGKKDIKGFVTAIKKSGVIGASLYDFPITTKAAWRTLKAVPKNKLGNLGR